MWAAIWVLSGCVSTQGSDLDGYVSVPMNRVVPYPSPEALEDRAFEVVVVNAESPGLDASRLEEPHQWVRRELRKIAIEAGARVRTRSDARLHEFEGSSIPGPTPDYDLVVRFEIYRDEVSWKPPFKFLWQSPAEVAGRPGVCTHRAEVAFTVEVIEAAREGRIRATYSLRHSAELEAKDIDPSCPLGAGAKNVLFETAMQESLGCLRAPLDRLLAPRGHVLAHLRMPGSDRDLIQISIGASQGIESGDTIEVRREQHASTPTGVVWRTERVIATGVVTNHVRADEAWVAIDLAKAADEILAGDVVRPVVREGLLSSLSGPDCKSILEER